MFWAAARTNSPIKIVNTLLVTGCLWFGIGCVREENRSPAICTSRAVERAVDPLGWVVRPRRGVSPPALDADAHIATNCDEALFRPVVRAPAPLSAAPDLLVRPLPRTTTIPVQNVNPQPEMSHCEDPLPLTTAVVIPAALTAVPPWSHLDDSDEDCVLRSDDSVSVIEERQMRNACIDSSDCAEQGLTPYESLPKSTRSLADIQPVVRDRIKKSPTSSSSDIVSEISTKDKSETVKGKTMQEAKNVADWQEKKADNVVVLPGVKIDTDVDCKEISISKVKSQNDIIISNKKKKNDKESTLEIKVSEKAIKVENSVMEKDPSDSGKIKSRGSSRKEMKKGITTVEKDNEIIYKQEPIKVDLKETKQTFKDMEVFQSERTVLKEESKEKLVKEVTPVPKDRKSRTMKLSKEIDPGAKIQEPEITLDLKQNNSNEKDLSLDLMTLKSPICNNTFESVSQVDYLTANIKTEEQAWDMLLNEPDRPIFSVYQASIDNDRTEECKPKSKKNRKLKKTQEEQQAKEDEDSFVEIHAIDEKQQPSGDLVSISTPFEDVESISSYLSKIKKSRIAKSFTTEKKVESESKLDIWSFDSKDTPEMIVEQTKSVGDNCGIEILQETTQLNSEQRSCDALKEVKADLDRISVTARDIIKPKKSKSLSPYSDCRKSSDKHHEEVKDVYVIDSTKEEFPEIQITTKASKIRKKSPLSNEKRNQEPKVADEPIKSWSSIAATKSVKKPKECEIKKLEPDKETEADNMNIAKKLDEDEQPEVSLHQKLVELCKRSDIILAVCDTPSELNFVEEHHSLLADFPPLEPLDFGLDDFKLEVMRDSLLEMGDAQGESSICNIHTNNVQSAVKAIENPVDENLFNIIELGKFSEKQEKDFNVVDAETITSNVKEAKVGDDVKFEDKTEVMEKSSDDDIASPALSADSDKEDKKSAGACNLTAPSLKQSIKSKKSRRKKK